MGWHTTPVVFPNQALYTNGSNAHGPAVVIADFAFAGILHIAARPDDDGIVECELTSATRRC